MKKLTKSQRDIFVRSKHILAEKPALPGKKYATNWTDGEALVIMMATKTDYNESEARELLETTRRAYIAPEGSKENKTNKPKFDEID